MNKFSLRTLGTSLLIAGLVTAGAAAPASAAVVSATSSVSSFTESTTSPAFTVTTAGLTTGGPFTEINIDVKKAGNSAPFVFWALASGCPITAGPLSGCKIASVSINGVPDSGATAKTQAMQPTTITVLPSSPVASGSTVSVSFDSGAFTTGAAGNWEVRLITYRSGWNSNDDSALAAVTTSPNGGGVSTPSTPVAEATLANTGINAVPYIATGGMLALAGATIMLFARRRFGN